MNEGLFGASGGGGGASRPSDALIVQKPTVGCQFDFARAESENSAATASPKLSTAVRTLSDTPDTAATFATGRTGIFHGMKSVFCQDERGQIAPVYSISAGLDYPGVGPEHAWLRETGRAEYVPVTDDEAVAAFELLSRTEGIIPAIESAHALAHAIRIAPAMPGKLLAVTLSGRGDKDCAAIARLRGETISE